MEVKNQSNLEQPIPRDRRFPYRPITPPRRIQFFYINAYTDNLLMRLSRYHLDERYLPVNYLAKNAIRLLAIGRKEYLFCGNPDAAENAAIMNSLLGCCNTSNVNPGEFLTYVFTRIPQYKRYYVLDLAGLLPHNWKKSNDYQNFPAYTTSPFP